METTEKVTYRQLNSANVRIDNSVDEDRAYDIAANANISGNPSYGAEITGESGAMNAISRVINVENGEVRRKTDGMPVATFNSYSPGNLSINHQNTEAEEQCTVTTAVNAFIAEVKAKAAGAAPLSL